MVFLNPKLIRASGYGVESTYGLGFRNLVPDLEVGGVGLGVRVQGLGMGFRG